LEQPVYTNEYSFAGKSLEAWVTKEISGEALHAVRSCRFVKKFQFGPTFSLSIRGERIFIDEIDIEAAFQVEWWTQIAKIGASNGMYDFLRKRVLSGQNQSLNITLDTQNWGEQISASEVPESYLNTGMASAQDGSSFEQMQFLWMENLPQASPKDAPDFEHLILNKQIVSDDFTD
jgi:hypothetical protein